MDSTQPLMRLAMEDGMLKRELAVGPQTASAEVSVRNRMRVLRCLIDEGEMSRVEVSRRTGMSPATVNRLTSSLMQQHFVVEAGNDEATGGRPSLVVRFNPQARTVLAVDVSEARIDVALLDLNGTALERHSVPLEGTSPDQKLERLVQVVADWDAREGERLCAVGVSVPGPVAADGVVLIAPALEWYDRAVAEPVQAVTQVPVTVENDVNLIALAEYLNLDSSEQKTLVALAVYQGVGAGIVEDGRLWRGVRGAAGQFGRMLRDVSGLTHQRHGFGHLESELGSRGLLRRAVAAGLLPADANSVDAAFERAAGGDPQALDLVRSIADDYSFHLVNVCAMIAPDQVVFGGLLERWADLLLPMIEERLEGNVVQTPELRASALGDWGKVLGAGMNGLRQAGGLESLLSR